MVFLILQNILILFEYSLSPGEILGVLIPEDVPIDIRVKLMICLIQQHVFEPLHVSNALTPTRSIYPSA